MHKSIRPFFVGSKGVRYRRITGKTDILAMYQAVAKLRLCGPTLGIAGNEHTSSVLAWRGADEVITQTNRVFSTQDRRDASPALVMLPKGHLGHVTNGGMENLAWAQLLTDRPQSEVFVTPDEGLPEEVLDLLPVDEDYLGWECMFYPFAGTAIMTNATKGPGGTSDIYVAPWVAQSMTTQMRKVEAALRRTLEPTTYPALYTQDVGQAHVT